jgi:hypothetical protein
MEKWPDGVRYDRIAEPRSGASNRYICDPKTRPRGMVCGNQRAEIVLRIAVYPRLASAGRSALRRGNSSVAQSRFLGHD